MTPGFSTPHEADGGAGYAELISDLIIAQYAESRLSPSNLRFSHLRPRVSRPPHLPPFGVAICRVVLSRAKEVVRGVAARGVVTRMAYQHPWGNRANLAFVDQPMQKSHLPFVTELNVSARMSGLAEIGPARIGATTAINLVQAALQHFDDPQLVPTRPRASGGALSTSHQCFIGLAAGSAGSGDVATGVLTGLGAKAAPVRLARPHGEWLIASGADEHGRHWAAPLCRASLRRWGAVQRRPLVGALARRAQAPTDCSPIIPNWGQV